MAGEFPKSFLGLSPRYLIQSLVTGLVYARFG